ncbi:MAG: DUF1003 domain-containing protein [Clostridiales bacterium]|nr:DUF1003 domain-containing protein [Clostridiales bacterium]
MNKRYKELMRHILTNVKEDLNDEEIIHLLLEHQVSENTQSKKDYTFGQKFADKIAAFVGSWTFIITFLALLIVWMAFNTYAYFFKIFDPYPFILLNLVLSCVAAIQAPLIMMSQNRQEQKDRQRSENDYKVNLKTEIMLEDLHEKLDSLIAKQNMLAKKINGLEAGNSPKEVPKVKK